ncbi:MAG: hypothetical protein RR253_02620 [Oscillospiraceae bacterium]
MTYFSVIEVGEGYGVIEFFGGKLTAEIDNFPFLVKETQLLKIENGKFVLDEAATAQKKRDFKSRLNRIAK